MSVQCDNEHARANNLENKNTNTNDVIHRWWFVILRMFADWWCTIRSSDIIALIIIIIIYKPQSVKVNDIQQYDEITCAIANTWIVYCTPHDCADIIAKKWKVCNYIPITLLHIMVHVSNSKQVDRIQLHTNSIIEHYNALVQ